MAAIIISDRGRCDAKCHEAQGPDCDCICGGRYHGTGSSEESRRRLTVDFFGPEWDRRRETFVENAKGPVVFPGSQLQLNL